MLAVHVRTVRLFVHVLAAAVWVGGQLTVAGLLPTLRAAGPDVPRAAARRFGVLAWSAFVVLVVTGIWNVLDTKATFTGAYGVTLGVKIVVVILSGVAAFVHQTARSRSVLAAFGAVAGVTALAALFLGVLLAAG